LNLCGKKINYWYKNFLSSFIEDQRTNKNYDTEDKQQKEVVYKREHLIDVVKTLERNRGKNREKKQTHFKTFYKPQSHKVIQNKKVRVPILKPENFGKRMCIDDKNLGDKGFTILSNLETGKIAAMIETRKSSIISEVLNKHVPEKILSSVEVLTKDLARNYEIVNKENFLQATSVADKFHVIKLGIQSISDLRVKYRQSELTKRRIERETHNSNKIYKSKRLDLLKRYSNGESILEILARTTRALSQDREKWGKNMQERIKILFAEFPEIEKIYKSIETFRNIYDVKVFGEIPFNTAKIELNNWLQSAKNSHISELQNFASTVKYNLSQILSYFKTGDTNAYAESLNSKLQRFLRENFGVKNLDFFLWRIKKIFS